MQSFLYKLYSVFRDFLSVSNIKKILMKLKSYWQSADIPGKLLIMVFFTPSLFVLFWLLFEIAYFVVFTLPGIVIRVIALVFLFGIFWSAAVYFYEKFHGVMSQNTIDAEKTDSTQNTEERETGKESDTEKVRRIRWHRKE